MYPADDERIQRAARLVSSAHAILVVAGAGIGVDSGLPDFRGQSGLWNAYPGLGRKKLCFSDIACPDAFYRDPTLAWGFYGHRLKLYRDTEPHVGFTILRRWMDQSLLAGAVFTTNVDGHFQKAGFDEKLLVEYHGSLHYMQCLNRCQSRIWSAEDFLPEVDEENCLLLSKLPRCPNCGGLARPNVLMFDDADWIAQRTLTQLHRLNDWLDEVNRLLIIEIGAGTSISTAREFTHRIAFERSAPVIRINPDEPGIYGDHRHVSLAMGAKQALCAIDQYLTSSPA